MKKTKRPLLKKLIKLTLISIAALLALTAVLNLAVCLSVKDRMYGAEDGVPGGEYDCIIVLGCAVWGDTPGILLSDRLDAAISLYKAGVAPKLLMSGDHGREDYDEVSAMRAYAMEQGVPSEDIFMDHAGFSTYETMCRAHDIFGVNKAVVVTQKYHLYRALYDACAFDIKAVGVIATGHEFAEQTKWDIREVLARVKDFFWCVFKPEPTYRGESIDITGNGEVTIG